MPDIFLTPASISYLNQFILTLAITLFLLNRLQSRRSRLLLLLTAFFALMMDIDHFKTLNDRYGHQAGDVVLQEVATRLRENLRPTDLAARYGGKKFSAILPRTSQNALQNITCRLNAAIRERPLEYKHSIIPVTISIGGAMLPPATRSLDDLLTQAHQAMYRAKAAGRNCAVLFYQSGSDDLFEK